MGEHELVKYLVQVVRRAGVNASPEQIISVYVALKTKPFLIIAGRQNGGKRAVLTSLMQVLGEGNLLQCQVMKGHVWSTGYQGSAVCLPEAQARMNSLKIFDLVNEASQAEHRDKIFIGCMERISRAELSVFFAEAAFQARHGCLMHLPYLHLTEPVSWSPNLLLVGTMDTNYPVQPDVELRSDVSIVEWQTERRLVVSPPPPLETDALCGRLFLDAMIRDEVAAHRKLAGILRRSVASGLLAKDLAGPDGSDERGMIVYLANAWSQEGVGLFDRADHRNLAVALGFARSNIASLAMPQRQISTPVLQEHDGQLFTRMS